MHAGRRLPPSPPRCRPYWRPSDCPPPSPPCRDRGGRRLLQQQLEQQQQREHHTHSEAWGTLRGAHQLLLTHRPRLGAQERAQLVRAVEAAGCHVAAYVPDSSLLLVGAADRAAAIGEHPAVLRLVRHLGLLPVATAWGLPACSCLHAACLCIRPAWCHTASPRCTFSISSMCVGCLNKLAAAPPCKPPPLPAACRPPPTGAARGGGPAGARVEAHPAAAGAAAVLRRAADGQCHAGSGAGGAGRAAGGGAVGCRGRPAAHRRGG